MADLLLSLAPLRASLQRFQRYLEVTAQDNRGTNVFEEIGRSVELVLADLARFGGPNEVTRARVRALAGQLEASERGGVFAWDREVEREAKILSPLLAAYIESLTVGGAA